MDVSSQCGNCRHLDLEAPGYYCAAFPDGVPELIIYNQFDHRLSHPDDHGIRYEAVNPEYLPHVSAEPDPARQPDPYADAQYDA